jgi:hypothetical protein
MAIAALVLGIIGVIFFIIPVLGPAISALGVVLGIVALVKKLPNRGVSVAGVATGGTGLLVGMFFTLLPLFGVPVFHTDSEQNEARVLACTIESAVTMYQAEHPRKCPTLEALKGEYLEADKDTRDPWGRECVIDCTRETDPEAYSLGPDGTGGKPIKCRMASER